VCVDTTSNPANCGACGHACSSGQSCQSGTCTCGAETNDCNGTCVDVLVDPANCGGCGKACPTYQFCQNGSCVQ
jgi:hypothetical protein